MNGVIYVGHLPHGFYKDELRQYFRQFGNVINVRVARNSKTGNCKGYAFVQFADHDVARIAAETMDNYLVFNKLLKCKLIPPEDVHPDIFLHKEVTKREIAEKIEEKLEEQNRWRSDWEVEEHANHMRKVFMKRNKLLRSMKINYQFPIRLENGQHQVTKKEEPEDNAEVSLEGENDDEEPKYVIDDSHLYTYLVDSSSDDEVSLKTPPKSVKRYRVKSRLSATKDKKTTAHALESKKGSKKLKRQKDIVKDEVKGEKRQDKPLKKNSKKEQKVLSKTENVPKSKKNKKLKASIEKKGTSVVKNIKRKRYFTSE